MGDNIIEIIIKAKDLASSEIEKLGKTVDKQANKIDQLGKTFQKAGLLLTGIGVGGAAIMNTWVTSAGEAEVEMAKVNAIIETVAEGNKVAFSNITKYVTEASNAYIKLGFDDESTALSFAKLFQATMDTNEANKLLALSADLARYKNVDLETATIAVLKASQGSTKELKAMGLEIDDNATATQNLAKIQGVVAGQAQAYSKTYQGAMAQMKVSTDNLKEALGERLLPMVTSFADKITGVVQALNNMNPKVLDLVVKITAMITAFGLTVGPLMTIVGTFMRFGKVLAAIGGAIASVGAGPILIVIGVIAGLIAIIIGVVQAIKNWDKIKEFANNAWNAIKQFVVNAKNAIGSFISNTIDSVTNFFIGLGTSISTWFNNLLTSIGTFILSAIAFFQSLPQKIGELLYNFFFVTIPFQVGYMIGYISTAVPKMIDNFILWVTQLVRIIPLKFDEMVQNVILGLVNWWTWLSTSIPVWWASFTQWVVDLALGVAQQFQNMWTWVTEKLTALWTWISTEVPTWPGKFIAWLQTLPDKIAEIFNNAKERAIEIAKGLYEGVKGWFDSVINWLKDIWNWGNKAAESISNAFNKGKNAGAVQGTRALGGWIDKTGLYLMHQGEYVMSTGMLKGTQRSEINNYSKSPTVNLYATVNNAVDMKKLAYSLAYELRNS